MLNNDINALTFVAKCWKLDLFEIMANQSNLKAQCTTCGKFDIKLDLVRIHRKYLIVEH